MRPCLRCASNPGTQRWLGWRHPWPSLRSPCCQCRCSSAGHRTRRHRQWPRKIVSGMQSHLSKGPSDLKQKCTQLLTLFSATVFNALSLSVILFVRSVRFRNRFLIGWNSSTANQKLPIQRFLELTLGRKWISPCERAWKTVLKDGVRVCVHFCLRPLVPLERCVLSFLNKVWS